MVTLWLNWGICLTCNSLLKILSICFADNWAAVRDEICRSNIIQRDNQKFAKKLSKDLVKLAKERSVLVSRTMFHSWRSINDIITTQLRTLSINSWTIESIHIKLILKRESVVFQPNIFLTFYSYDVSNCNGLIGEFNNIISCE